MRQVGDAHRDCLLFRDVIYCSPIEIIYTYIPYQYLEINNASYMYTYASSSIMMHRHQVNTATVRDD